VLILINTVEDPTTSYKSWNIVCFTVPCNSVILKLTIFHKVV